MSKQFISSKPNVFSHEKYNNTVLWAPEAGCIVCREKSVQGSLEGIATKVWALEAMKIRSLYNQSLPLCYLNNEKGTASFYYNFSLFVFPLKYFAYTTCFPLQLGYYPYIQVAYLVLYICISWTIYNRLVPHNRFDSIKQKMEVNCNTSNCMAQVVNSTNAFSSLTITKM